MKVELLAHTVVVDEAEAILSRPETATDADYLVEIAGRECYQSQHRPNEATEQNDDYVAHIIKQRHFSVLEHASFTVRVSDVSRALSHELVRHRHFSFSQLSQRFVDADTADYVIHPDIRDIEDEDRKEKALDILESVWEVCLEAYGELQTILDEEGRKRKVRNQAARMVLPNMTTTIVVVTGNHRSWREFFKKRLAEGADTEIRELAREIESVAQRLAPASHFYPDIQ